MFLTNPLGKNVNQVFGQECRSIAMCFGGGKKQQEESNKAAAQQRIEAEAVKEQELQKKALQKREDISDAISKQKGIKGMRGGTGRRSLFRSGGQGFLSRFDY